MIDRATDILGLVDVQPTFMPGGELPVADGDAVVPVINRLLARFDHAFATQDWHPPGHARSPARIPGQQAIRHDRMPYGQQVLWPDHAMQGSANAALHRDLDLTRVEVIIRKGFHPDIDSYSAFFENDRAPPPAWMAGCASAVSDGSSWRDWQPISASPGRPRMRCAWATR